MYINCKMLAAAVGLTLAVAGTSEAFVDTLRVGGTGGATGLLNYLAPKASSDIGAKVEVIPSLGSGGAIRAVNDGVINVAVSGRKLKPAEMAKGLTVRFAMRTPYVMVSSRRTDDGLKSAEIAAIYANEKAKWLDGSMVRIILRPKSDSDTAHLGQLFPGMREAIAKARKRPDISLAATDQDNADLAERMPGSLSGATFTQIKMENRRLQVIPIDGAAPTFENFAKGDYPFGKTFYVVTSAKPSAATEKFIAYLRSPAGRQALRESGNLPIGE